MNIEAVLEGWLIADERYPAFRKDDLVKLAFSIEETELKESDSDTLYFRQVKGAAFYQFNAEAVGIYEFTDTICLIAFDAGNFKFYIAPYETDDYKKGKVYSGCGTLLVDYFFWAENCLKHKSLPDLYYKFRIEKIERIAIPEGSKVREEGLEVFRTKLSPEESSQAVRVELAFTGGDIDFCSSYFVLSMTNEGLENVRIPISYGRSSLGKEIIEIGKIGELEVNVQTGNDPPHFHIVKRDFFDLKVNISNLKIIGYEWQINNAEISIHEMDVIQEWLSGKYNSSPISNIGYIKFIWMSITIGGANDTYER